jgi:homoserine O-succinyltransferase
MPIKIQHDLPARAVLEEENVDLIFSDAAMQQDIRPLKLILLNLMPKKKETEIQFARLLGNSPLQLELTLMTTASYTPRNTEPGYLRR